MSGASVAAATEPEEEEDHYANFSEIQAQRVSASSTGSAPPLRPRKGADVERSVGDWDELKDSTSGRCYYFNRTTNDCTWTQPKEFTSQEEGAAPEQVVSSAQHDLLALVNDRRLVTSV